EHVRCVMFVIFLYFYSIFFLFFFFFFQAEDGIRDFHVTGVQTCALPISVAAPGARPSPDRERERIVDPKEDGALLERGEASIAEIEERRVGKECRSRWSPYH